MSDAVFDVNGAAVLADELRDRIHAPHVSARVSTLGGAHRPSVMLTIGFDPRETWANGIFENSRYVKLYIHHDGEVGLTSDSGLQGQAAKRGYVSMAEHTTLRKRWRKVKAKLRSEIVDKINKYVSDVSDTSASSSHGRYAK